MDVYKVRAIIRQHESLSREYCAEPTLLTAISRVSQGFHRQGSGVITSSTQVDHYEQPKDS